MKRDHRRFRIGLFLALFMGVVILLAVCPAMLPAGSATNYQEKGGRTKTTPTPAPRATPRTSRATPRRTSTPATTSNSGASSRSAARQTAPQIEMVLIPAGTFTMGSPATEGGDNEKPSHRVTVQSFYMGKYEVTQAQHRAVVGTNPSNFKGDNLPVEQVSWNDAVEFCRKLSQMTGKEYRLPSEAEWEYACRAGTSGPYAGDLDSMGWYSNNSGSRTHPVGQKQPNAFGLYDMHGNVWEWCEDWYQDNYDGAPVDGSGWQSGGDRGYRVLRGGSWFNVALLLRSANRNFNTTGYRNDNLGFRVVALARA